MSKDKKYDKDYFESILEACEEECYKRAPNVKSSHRQSFVEACGVFYEAWEASKKAESKDELVKIAAVQEKSMKKCIKTGKKIFDKLDLVGDSDLPENIMKGAILVRATTSGLAEFCQEDKKHGKLIDYLLNDISLMKDMLLNGGAKNGLYGPAIKIYVEILSTFGKKDEFTVTNKKIAMAVCLELADPINEFDTKIPVSSIACLPSIRCPSGETLLSWLLATPCWDTKCLTNITAKPSVWTISTSARYDLLISSRTVCPFRVAIQHVRF